MEPQKESNIVEYKDRQYSIKRPQYKMALKILDDLEYSDKQKKELKVLDLGCGTGEFADLLVKRGFAKDNIQCCDGLQEFVEQVKGLGFSACKTDLEFEKLPFSDGEFDLVVSLEVIEHLWNIDHYFAEIKRVLKKDGFVVITTPNYNFIKFRIKHLLGKLEEVIPARSRHKKFFTAKSMYKELSNEFSVVEYLGSTPKLEYFLKNSRLQNLLSVQMGFLGRNNKQDIDI